MSTTKTFVINNVSLPFNASSQEAFSVAEQRLRSQGVRTSGLEYSIFRRSVDARKKQDIRFVYSIAVTGRELSLDKNKADRISLNEYTYEEPDVVYGNRRLESDIVVVGSGPCGLFCALMLAEHGYRPVLLERGGSVDERKRAIVRFQEDRVLDTNTNIQFGAGGAGTFSDGKLVTRISDPMTGYVLEKLVEFGAPKDIVYLARPHIGTDILSVIVEKIIDKIVSLGGKIYYNTEFIDYVSSGNKITAVKTSKGVIPCSELVLAIGHSARDTYKTLINRDLDIEAKPFSVGMRIEHPVELIDRGMYGDAAGDHLLGHAEYNLSHNTKARGVYTFCMCPGGVVVPATSEQYGVVTNGMSYHARDGRNSNSAVCCSIFKEDYGSTPLGAIQFQQQIERAAYIAGGSNYSAPIITVGDFLADKVKNTPNLVSPTYMDGVGVTLADPNSYLPRFVVENIKEGIVAFNKKITGFSDPSAVLTGPETRTSAPIRILRDFESGASLAFSNLYPSGEGAGYAGGITSAAVDGLKTALHIIKKYKPD